MPHCLAVSSAAAAIDSLTAPNMLPKGAPPNPNGPGGTKRAATDMVPPQSISARQPLLVLRWIETLIPQPPAALAGGQLGDSAVIDQATGSLRQRGRTRRAT